MRKKADLNRLSRGGCLGLGIVFSIVLSVLHAGASLDIRATGWWVYFVISLFLIPMAWLRLKDSGQNAWWSLGILVPGVGFAVALWCVFAPSRDEGEAYPTLAPGRATLNMVLKIVSIAIVVPIGLVVQLAPFFRTPAPVPIPASVELQPIPTVEDLKPIKIPEVPRKPIAQLEPPIRKLTLTPPDPYAADYDQRIFNWAHLTVSTFCWRVQNEHNVSLTVDDFLQNGTRTAFIELAQTLTEVEQAGQMNEFVKTMAEKRREALKNAK